MLHLLTAFFPTMHSQNLRLFISFNVSDTEQCWNKRLNTKLKLCKCVIFIGISNSYLRIFISISRNPLCYSNNPISQATGCFDPLNGFAHRKLHSQATVTFIAVFMWLRECCPIVRLKTTRCHPPSHLTLPAKLLIASPLMSFLPSLSHVFVPLSFPRWLSILHSRCSFSLLCSWGPQCG